MKNGNNSYWWGIFFAVISFVVIATASYLFFLRFRDEGAREDQTHFVRAREVVQKQIENEVGRIQGILFSLSGLFAGSEEVTRKEFDTFNESQRLKEGYPSLYTVVYVQVVKAADLPVFEREMKREIPLFAVFPAGEREDYYVIKYETPVTAVKSVIGFDPGTDLARKAVLDRARDTGEPAMSGGFSPVLSDQRHVFLVTMPIYRKGSPVSSVEERRKAITGFVAALYLKDQFFSEILSRLQFPGLEIEVFDGDSPSAENLYFDSDADRLEALSSDAGTLSDWVRYEHLGHLWSIFYTYHPASVFSMEQILLPNIILYFGLIFAFLIAILIIILSSSRSRAVKTAREMTGDLGKFKQAVDNDSGHIIITDPDAKIIYANAAVSTITGYSNEEIIGNNPRLWGGQMGEEFYKKMWQQIKFEKKPFRGEIKNKRKNGELYTAIMTISPILDEKGNLLGFVGQEDDITERVKIEEKLAEESRKLTEEKTRDEVILTSIGEGVVVVDENGKIILLNPEGAKMFGVTVGDVIGKNYKDVWEVKDSLGNVVVNRPIQKTLASGEIVATGEYFYTNKDKSVFPVYLTVSPTIQNGKIIGAVDVFRDITKEKTIDRAKSEFVSLASHQLRTPLSAVNWYAEMLLSGDLGAVDPNQKKYLEEIYDANRRMVELVNALLNVSRIDLGTFAIEPEELALDKLAKSIISELQPQIVYKKLQLGEHYDPLLPTIKADPKLTRIIIQNLLTNSVRYTADGGKVDLELNLIKSGSDVGNRKAAFDGILIKVSDNGFGIPENVKDKIFGKLFRADNAKVKVSEGTGLGLYIVKSIIDAVSGSIWFDSVENQGTTFYVLLPLGGMPKKEGTKQLNYDTLGRVFA